MRLLGRRRDAEDLTFTLAAEPPWLSLGAAAALWLFAALALVGVELPPASFPLLVPVLLALAFGWIVAKRLGADTNVDVFEGESGRELRLWDGGRGQSVRLRELATVSREVAGAPPTLTLSDLQSGTVTIPLGVWARERRLLDEVHHAITQSGAKGAVGNPVIVRRPAWVAPIRIATPLVMFVAIAVLIARIPESAGEPALEPVTRERLAETAGLSAQPFAGTRRCEVYVVPLDRPSEGRARSLARSLRRLLPVSACPTPSHSLDPEALDGERGQLDGSIIAGQLFNLFLSVWESRPASVVGITQHDLFTSASRELRFTFGFSFRNATPQAFSALSTARMGSSDDRMRRLETMAVRYLGTYHFGLELSDDRESALYHTIRSRDDLDRMRPQLSDPPPTEASLRVARQRFLAEF
ncbi:MAG: hypothetical protein ACRDQT_11070 [Gaiellaceae bacterium]